MKDYSLSVILPAFNEEENIVNTLNSCVEYLGKTFPVYEIIVVNDCSSDRTGELVEEYSAGNSRVRLVSHSFNQGSGAAHRTGLDNGSMDHLFYMDSDGQFDINELDKFLDHIEDNTMIIGYRAPRADPFIRIVNERLYHFYIRLLFGLRIRDIDCAFKLFPRHIYESVKPVNSSGAMFSVEFLLKVIGKGFAIKEIPVTHYPRLYGKQTGAELRVILRMFKESWQFRKEYKSVPGNTKN